MITISDAAVEDFSVIQTIARQTWPIAYGNINSQAQIDYMLDLFYSDEALLENSSKNGHQFILAKENDANLGFASYEHNYLNQKVTRLHKLYVLPDAQGKSIGKILINAVEKSAKDNQSSAVSLNVNKINKALDFYIKNGYEIVAEEVLDIGHGYVMDDYKMEKQL